MPVLFLRGTQYDDGLSRDRHHQGRLKTTDGRRYYYLTTVKFAL